VCSPVAHPPTYCPWTYQGALRAGARQQTLPKNAYSMPTAAGALPTIGTDSPATTPGILPAASGSP
jgi:hypothetical protein